MAERKIRPIRIQGNLAYITLTKGYEAVIDAADVPLVEEYNWRVAVQPHTSYAMRHGEPSGTVYLHRSLIAADALMSVDHIDGDGLNNRRSNLREATRFQNNRNSRRPRTNTSGYKGVSWNKKLGKWQARIRASSNAKWLGAFDTREAAHEAYCKAAERLHGEFAKFG